MKIYTLLFLCFLTVISFAQDSKPVLTKEQKEKELSILHTAFVQLHPGLYRYNTESSIQQSFSVLYNSVTPATDAKSYFVLVSQFTAKIKCGHTFPNPWNQEAATKDAVFSNTCFPLLYKMIGRKMIVAYNLSNNKMIQAGDEIKSINNIDASSITDSLLTVIRADGNNAMQKKLNNLNLLPADIDSNSYSLFDIYFPLFFAANFNTPAYTVEIEKAGGNKNIFTIAAFTKTKRQKTFAAKYGTILTGEQNWQFRFLQPSIAYLKIGDFVTWSWKKDYKKYLDSIFSILKNQGTKNLILDVRGNEGGDDDTRNELLSYLIPKPFGCDNPEQRLYKFLTVPDTLLPYLQTWNDDFKKPKDAANYSKTPDGLYKQKTGDCISIQPKPNVFKGSVYVLIDAKNSSTTFTLADLLQTTHAATLIGEETGGTKQGLNGGQFFWLHLPYSHIEIDLPLIYQAPAKPRPDEGVKPDYEILTTAYDLKNNNDAQLNKAILLIKK